jgi:hypothetical protein
VTKIALHDLFPATDHDTARSSNSSKYKSALAEAHRRHLAAFFFHGLSNESHQELKKKIHNNALTGLDTVPRTYNKVLQLADQCKSSYQPHPAGGGGGGMAFSQKGKAGSHTPASTPLDTSAKKSAERRPHPVPGKKDMAGKMIANAAGKKNFFNCGMDDHWVVNCSDLTAAQREELAGMAQAHISVSKNVLNGIRFLRNKSTNAAILTTRKTLNPHRLYLDSTSSFHQVFSDKHLDHLKTVGVTLCTNCTAGTNFATEKGWFQDLF